MTFICLFLCLSVICSLQNSICVLKPKVCAFSWAHSLSVQDGPCLPRVHGQREPPLAWSSTQMVCGGHKASSQGRSRRRLSATCHCVMGAAGGRRGPRVAAEWVWEGVETAAMGVKLRTLSPICKAGVSGREGTSGSLLEESCMAKINRQP